MVKFHQISSNWWLNQNFGAIKLTFVSMTPKNSRRFPTCGDQIQNIGWRDSCNVRWFFLPHFRLVKSTHNPYLWKKNIIQNQWQIPWNSPSKVAQIFSIFSSSQFFHGTRGSPWVPFRIEASEALWAAPQHAALALPLAPGCHVYHDWEW